MRERFGRLPGTVKLFLFAFAAFNIGFYLIVPFLALHLQDGLGLAAAAVGAVVGLRMASQQGLFLLGGILADRLGPRPLILLGTAVRVAGLALIAVAESLPLVVAAVVLIGLAGALFAPAVESANAAFGSDLEARGVMRRVELFGLEQMFSRAGTVIGPILGGLLLLAPFAAVALVSAGLFAALFLAFLIALPRGFRPPGADGREGTRGALVEVLGGPRFLLFCLLAGVQLAGQNLMFLLLPHTLAEVGLTALITPCYVLAALLVIGSQPLASRIAVRRGTPWVIGAGLAIGGLSFLPPALGMMLGPTWAVAVGTVLWILLLHAGQVLAAPALRDATTRLAGSRRLGAHFGLLNTVSGIMALGLAWLVGRLLELEGTAMAAGLPWAPAAIVMLVAAGTLAWWLPRVLPRS